MSLIFAGCIPNHPHCVKESMHPDPAHRSATLDAITELEGELYFMKPDTVVILTQHQVVVPDVINMHINPSFTHELFFGATIKTDALFTSELKGSPEVQSHSLPLTIVAEPQLDDRIASTIGLLFRHISEHAKVVVISLPKLPTDTLKLFGEFLKREIMRSESRIALIGSGHLSVHTLEHPAEAQSFDHLVQTFFEAKQFDQILAMNPEIVAASNTDMFSVLTVFFSCLKETNILPKVFSYEQHENEGITVLNCILQ